MAEQKRYTVRKGKETWVFTTRSEVQPLVIGYQGAKYKSFPTLQSAEHALQSGRELYYQPTPKQNLQELPFIKTSIAVDAACSSATGILEYQGIDLQSQQLLFHQKFPVGTNNIGEFLAIVHALAILQKEKKSEYVIYSDSKIAINRIAQGKCKTNLVPTPDHESLFNTIKNAEKWLSNNPLTIPILKRNTQERGEIPADFGRK